MVKTGADLHTGAEENRRCGGFDEGDEGSDEEAAGDEEDMGEGAANVQVEEILYHAFAEDEEGFTKILQSPMLTARLGSMKMEEQMNLACRSQ